MGISFDHVQYVTDLKLMLGEATSEIAKTSPMTDEEFYRALVDPGFEAAIAAFEGHLKFERYSSVSQGVSWRWQIRSKGESAWTDIAAATETWGGYASTERRVYLDASALGGSDSAPFEIRLLATAAAAATVKIRIGTDIPAVRVIGESV